MPRSPLRRRSPATGAGGTRAATLALISVWLTLALGAAGTLAGADSDVRAARRPSAAGERPCPGARRCPYHGVEIIGSRGGDVLRAPEAIAVGPGGVFVGDQFSHVVRRFSPEGRFESEWGSDGEGPGQFGAVGGLALDSAGDVYLVDSSHDRVEEFTGAGRFLRSWGREGSRPGEFRFGAGAGPDMPPGGGIAVSAPYVFVADTENNRIERFRLDGSEPRVIATPGGAPGQVVGPRGLAAIGGVVYVTDEGNDRVQELDAAGRPLAQVDSLPALPATFANPYDVAADRSNVFVVDDNDGRVVKLTRNLQFVEGITGEGAGELSKYLRAAAADAAGRLYVADTGHDRVEVFDGEGRLVRGWGVSGISPGQFVAPLALARAPDGEILVTEAFGPQSPLYLYSPALSYLATWTHAGEAVIGTHWFAPTAAAFAADGTAWVLDTPNDVVRHLSATGAFLGTAGETGPGEEGAGALRHAFGVAVDEFGDLLVADTEGRRVEVYSSQGAPLGAWSGRGRRSAGMEEPLAVAVAPTGVSYVLDAGAGRVLALGTHGELLATWPLRAPGGAPIADPRGLAVDGAGHLFISDAGADRVVELAPDGSPIRAWGEEGSAPGELDGPTGIVVDCAGDVLVADTRNNRIEAFTGVATPPACPGLHR